MVLAKAYFYRRKILYAKLNTIVKNVLDKSKLIYFKNMN